MNTPSFEEEVVAATRRWLEKAVIGLNLCPFAKSVHMKGQIHYIVSAAQSVEELQSELVDALLFLQQADPAQVDTVLLIHPHVLDDFLEFNDFLEAADMTTAALGLEGDIQVASFHPHYQFAGTDSDDISNYTNRSPYPTLHLLRESSIDRAVEAFPEASDIFEKNIETLERLGRPGWDALFDEEINNVKKN
ncbi:DUF1415 domain-containing protein [Noviherbaspirillum denitrificans]|uniref:Peptidase n=1 Tax=Noviherbaspirillum denitrificans TaxID=1968433 RepID=A0A254T7W2_9BURK|nr:DUF1415 domain-containing protein [Noviherbaspirillum denitrificans]OWW18736.1 hypothetical protein AYR66_03975 [Noviherbaspirillum denitrificans]